jgi:hypothetical protein
MIGGFLCCGCVGAANRGEFGVACGGVEQGVLCDRCVMTALGASSGVRLGWP